MKVHVAAIAFAVAIAPLGPVYAAEGANAGSANSTLAGPAGDNQGPSKMGNPSSGSGGAMKSGATGAGATGTTSGTGGDSSAGGGSRNGDHGN